MTTARAIVLALFLSLTLIFSPTAIEAQLADKAKTSPRASLSSAPYDFEAAFIYQGLTLSPQDEPQIEISLTNKGLNGDTFSLEAIEIPTGWVAQFKRYSNIISGIYLSKEETATLYLTLTSPNGADQPTPIGNYPTAVKIISALGGQSIEIRSTLKISDQKERTEILSVNTSYPEISGASDGRFSFSLDLRNDGPEDALVNLTCEPPPQWEASFKPGYEDKQISSIHVPKNQSRSVTLDLTPAQDAQPGPYTIKVKAEQPLGSAEAALIVNLRGTFKIRAISANDLLSTQTEVGRPVTVSLFILNEGSAPQKEITFLAVKPDNWKVEFKPEKILNLAPAARPAQVEMTITPAPNSLVGDYGLGLSVQGEKSQNNLDFRVSVKSSAAWTWLGAALIVIVVALMSFIFRRFGRR
ncbi:MAG: hypothetical protein LBV23_07460 [Deltaproteobacteria bacterium]|nr:hypothetical protein [Deltaproteobacteria bacterium]